MTARVQFWVTPYRALWGGEVAHAEAKVDTDDRVDGCDGRRERQRTFHNKWFIQAEIIVYGIRNRSQDIETI